MHRIGPKKSTVCLRWREFLRTSATGGAHLVNALMMSDGSGQSRLNEVGASTPPFFSDDVDDLTGNVVEDPIVVIAAGGRFLDDFDGACALLVT